MRSFEGEPSDSVRDRAPLTIEGDRDVGPHRCAWGPVCALTLPPTQPSGLQARLQSEEHMTHHRVWRLRELHRELDRRIREEQRRPNPDALLIHDLKRRKLQVKDELFMAEAGLVPVTVRMARG